MKLNLNVRNLPPPVGGIEPPSVPPRTPAEIAAFKASLAQIVNTYPPELLTVENEENAPKFFSGSAAEYLRELRAAIHVARPLGIPVTNGGITSVPLALMTWNSLRHRKGQEAADEFAHRAFDQASGRGSWRKLLDDLLARPYRGIDNASLERSWNFAKKIVRGLRAPRHPGRAPTR